MPETNEFTFKEFCETDYEEYKSWFKNPIIQKYLGPINKDWLKYILSDKKGLQLAISTNNKLLAVAELLLPTKDDSSICITDFIIHPERQRSGYGTTILQQLMVHPSLSKFKMWQAYIDESNHSAISFFLHNGWQVDPTLTIEQSMIPVCTMID